MNYDLYVKHQCKPNWLAFTHFFIDKYVKEPYLTKQNSVLEEQSRGDGKKTPEIGRNWTFQLTQSPYILLRTDLHTGLSMKWFEIGMEVARTP